MEMNSQNPLIKLEALIGRTLLWGGAQILKWQLGARREVFRGEVDIPYIRIDGGHSETLVNLPGFGDDKETFLLVAKALQHRFNVILPDTVGFGETARDLARSYTLDEHTRWVTAFLKHLNCGPVWLVGNSLGGAIASSVAFESPDLVKKCVPIGPAGYLHSQSNPLFEELVEGHNIFLIEDNKGYRSFIQRLFHHPRKPIPFISAALREKMIDDSSWYRHVTQQLTRQIDFNRKIIEQVETALNVRIGGTDVPFHFIWGASDSFFDARIMDELKETYPAIGTTLLEECGHCPHLESPQRLARALLEI